MPAQAACYPILPTFSSDRRSRNDLVQCTGIMVRVRVVKRTQEGSIEALYGPLASGCNRIFIGRCEHGALY